MALIVCLILMSGVFADSNVNDVNEGQYYEYREPEVAVTLSPTYQPVVEATYATPYKPHDSAYVPTYGPVYNPTVPAAYPPSITPVPPVMSYVTSSTPSNSYSPSTRAPILTPFELYQSRWCAGLLRSPQPFPSDPSKLAEFEEQYVIPEYRSLWYRTCYLPHRGFGIATLWFDRGLGIANTAFRGAIQTADSAIGVGTNVLREVLSPRMT